MSFWLDQLRLQRLRELRAVAVERVGFERKLPGEQIRRLAVLDLGWELGVLAQPEVIQGATDPRFLGVGAPVGVWAGIVIEDPT